ncbi:hypothetical protein ACFE04_002115 [Oxalis oulophora]
MSVIRIGGVVVLMVVVVVVVVIRENMLSSLILWHKNSEDSIFNLSLNLISALILFHTNAVQALGKIPIDVSKWNISLMSLSRHNIYGPKGVGALYLRRRPRIRVELPMNGGVQEQGIRCMTVPTQLVVGFGAACELAKLLVGINKKLDGVVLNGSVDRRYAENVNISFVSLMMGLEEVVVSSGSACTNASLEPSYVLREIWVDEDITHTSIRFGIV